MYKVVVADDEEIIRRGLIDKVKWGEYGFEVVGEAENGVDALEIIEELEPDLVITDIRMPFLSGIELAREIRQVRPMTSIVFLSGFDDFSYAQQAIQYNIVSYLLKPITSKEFEKELIHIKEAIDKKFEGFLNSKAEKERLEKSEFLYPLLFDGYLKSNADEQEYRQIACEYGLMKNIDETDIMFSVMITEISDEYGINETNKSNISSIEMLATKYMHAISCYLKGRIVTILSGSNRTLAKYTPILTDEIVQSVERIMQRKCTIGVSGRTDKLLLCRECYIDAMNAIHYAINTESNIFYITDQEKSYRYNHSEIQSIIDELERLLRGGEDEELVEFLNRIENQVVWGSMPRVVFRYVISQIVTTVFSVVYVIAGECDVNNLQSMYRMDNFISEEIIVHEFARIKGLCIVAKKMIAEKRKQTSNRISEKVLQVIESEYMNHGLSVQWVSDYIGVSPNYLSSVMKKDTGCNFVELLTKKRIKKAEELLIDTNMKIRDIADECGYSDQYYFSHCFKKITGKSPGVYRKSNEE